MPSTFEVDSWRAYDYFTFACTLLSFFLDHTISGDAAHTALSLCVVLCWIRLLRFQGTLDKGIGVLVGRRRRRAPPHAARPCPPCTPPAAPTQAPPSAAATSAPR